MRLRSKTISVAEFVSPIRKVISVRDDIDPDPDSARGHELPLGTRNGLDQSSAELSCILDIEGQ
jgi:hypothetical protein